MAFVSGSAAGRLRLAPSAAAAGAQETPVAHVTHGPPRIRNVYIPADQIELLFANSSKGVLMPRDKVAGPLEERPSAMLRRRRRRRRAAVLSRAVYGARLEGRQLHVTGRSGS